MSAARFENAKTRFSAKSAMSRSGCSARRSQATKATRATTPAPASAHPVGGGQPAQAVHEGREPGPVEDRPGDVEAVAAATRATPPPGPTRPSLPRSRPGRTLAANTLRQPRCCVSRPPSGGPSERPRYTAATFTPRARPRFPGGKIEVRSAIAGAEDHPAAEALADPPGQEEGDRTARGRTGATSRCRRGARPRRRASSRGCRRASRRARGRRRRRAGTRWPPSSGRRRGGPSRGRSRAARRSSPSP